MALLDPYKDCLRERIEELRSFVPTQKQPRPPHYGLDDILAVAAGGKPLGFTKANEDIPQRAVIETL